MSIPQIISNFKHFVKVQFDKETIDNYIFRCHYRLTTLFFWISSVLLTAYSFIGKPISCLNDSKFDIDFINQYCWTTGTYTLMSGKKGYQFDFTDARLPPTSANDDGRVHDYYQWVPFVLFFHGVCFYLPHWIWKTWEGGKIKLLSDDIRRTAIADTEERQKKRELVVDYIHRTMNHHMKYAYAYFGCEVLNLIITISTIFLINAFLGNVFLAFGLDLIGKTLEDPVKRMNNTQDTLMKYFPRMTICDLETYGLAGIKQLSNSLCVLPLNALNEKIYIFAWFWLVFLASITFCRVAYMAAFLFLPDIRQMVIYNRLKFDRTHKVDELIKRIGVGDFLLLHFLGKNLSTWIFRKLLEEVNAKLLPKEIEQSADTSSSGSDDQDPPAYDETEAADSEINTDANDPLIPNSETGDELQMVDIVP